MSKHKLHAHLQLHARLNVNIVGIGSGRGEKGQQKYLKNARRKFYYYASAARTHSKQSLVQLQFMLGEHVQSEEESENVISRSFPSIEVAQKSAVKLVVYVYERERLLLCVAPDYSFCM